MRPHASFLRGFLRVARGPPSPERSAPAFCSIHDVVTGCLERYYGARKGVPAQLGVREGLANAAFSRRARSFWSPISGSPGAFIPHHTPRPLKGRWQRRPAKDATFLARRAQGPRPREPPGGQAPGARAGYRDEGHGYEGKPAHADAESIAAPILDGDPTRKARGQRVWAPLGTVVTQLDCSTTAAPLLVWLAI